MKQTNTDMNGFFNKEIEAQVSKEIDENMIPNELETLTVSIPNSSIKVNVIKDKTAIALSIPKSDMTVIKTLVKDSGTFLICT